MEEPDGRQTAQPLGFPIAERSRRHGSSSYARYQTPRDTNGVAINAIAKHVPTFLGGDADLSSSTKTTIKDGGDFEPGSYGGRNLHYGVREHAMGSITNGISVHGGIIKPFTATFMTFSAYIRPAIRLASVMDIC